MSKLSSVANSELTEAMQKVKDARKEIEVEKIVGAYADELKDWDFFSDAQRAHLTEDGKIVVCLRNYNWYITKSPITDAMLAIKALFEIDWIAEYSDGYEDEIYIKCSKYWEKY